jgi:hypothetical protein
MALLEGGMRGCTSQDLIPDLPRPPTLTPDLDPRLRRSPLRRLYKASSTIPSGRQRPQRSQRRTAGSRRAVSDPLRTLALRRPGSAVERAADTPVALSYRYCPRNWRSSVAWTAGTQHVRRCPVLPREFPSRTKASGKTPDLRDPRDLRILAHRPARGAVLATRFPAMLTYPRFSRPSGANSYPQNLNMRSRVP